MDKVEKDEVKWLLRYVSYHCLKRDLPLEQALDGLGYKKEKTVSVAEDEKNELVDHPKHYGGDSAYECIKVLKAWMSKEELVGFCKGNAIKYLCRAGKKDAVLQEWKKAAWYIKKGIELMEAKDEN